MRFNEVIARNKDLRAKIENLRRERVVFDQIYKRMEKELHKKKKEMALIIEESNEAYEERDKTVNRLKVLKQHRDDEMAKLDERFKELDKIIRRDTEINERLKAKEKERMNREILLGGLVDDGTGLLTKKRGGQGKGNAADRKAKQRESNSRKAKRYEENFRKIERAAGMSIDELCDKFSTAEDNNFSLFTYVNELNTEIEKLEERIGELEDELKKYKGDGAASDVRKKKVLRELRSRVIRTTAKADEYRAAHATTMSILRRLCSRVQKSFDATGCDSKMVNDILGTAGVSEANLMIYLGIIERRVNELLRLRAASKSSDENIIIGPRASFGANRLRIEPPSTGGDEADEAEDDDEEKPITREELMRRSITQRKPPSAK